MSTNAVTTFLAQLRQAQLLDEAQLAEVERLGQTATRPAEVAAELIERGWLTSHQANQVARGRGAELLLGSYVVLEPLGRGGMGQVVKARHRYLHRQVALKFIRPDQRASADMVQRFQREARLLADLRHSHIVQAYDAGNVGETLFLAMELLDGVDLDRLVRQRGPLPVGQTCDFIRQAALGLQHAHERGLVHRDLKPSNFFLTGEGIKLLDLGLARSQAAGAETQPGDLTRANSVMGTPDYLAPEQALDPRRADARSDLYSLGCTLYCLLTGRPPFPEGTLAQKLLSHQSVEPPPVETLRREVPPALADLLRRLLAKSPAQRPASAAEVAAALAPLATPTADGVAAALLADVRGATVSRPPQGNLNTAMPRRGSTLPAEAVPLAGPASLANARTDTPERGFTLMAESMPPTSLVGVASGGPERGFTLMAESMPPTAVPAPGSPMATADAKGLPASSPGGVPSGLSRARIPLGLAIGVACPLLLLLGFAILWMSGAFADPQTGAPTASSKPGQTPKAPESENPKTAAAEKPKKTEAVKPKKEEPVTKAVPPPSWLFPGGPSRFLSELESFDVNPGAWPIKTGDNGNGQPIKVGGKLSPHGLGMHPPAPPKYASVKYRLGKEADLFKATVAIDDSSNFSFSPAVFTVLGDGKKLWQSRHVSPEQGRSRACQVVVKGVEVLELRVHAVGAHTFVHAVWVEPRVLRSKKEDLVKKPAPGPNKLFPSGPRRLLSELESFDVTPGEWPIKVGDTGKGKPIEVGGVLSPHGLGMHPPAAPKYASIKYRLGKKAQLFKATVAIDDTTKWCWSPAIFTVLGDGKELWRSEYIAHNYARTEECQVDVEGVDVLELRVHVPNGNRGVHAFWVEPRVLQTIDSADEPGKPGAREKLPRPKGKEGAPSPVANPKETEGVFLLPTIAPDAKLAKLKSDDKVFLSDLNEFSFKTVSSNWKFGKHGRVGDPKAPDSLIRVNGTPYPKGLGMRPPYTAYVRVCYALGKRVKSLHGSVALDDGDDPPWSIKTTTFVAIGDGKVLWRSHGIKDKGVIEPFTVDVRGVAVLELRVYTDYNGANASRAAWLDPYVVGGDK